MELIRSDDLVYHSPSRARGMSYQEELKLRKDSCLFISSMGQARKMGQLAIATASVYFQHFFAKLDFKTKDKYGVTRGYDRHEIAAACLFLAGKVEERPQRVHDIVHAFFRILRKQQVPDSNSREFERLRLNIEANEILLLSVIEFNFSVKHPYTILVTNFSLLFGPEYANKSSEHQKGMKKSGSPLQNAWFFVNDSLRSTACLLYSPESIAVAVIFMALQNSKTEVKKCPELIKRQIAEAEAKGKPRPVERPWYEELFGTKKSELDAISRLIRQVIDHKEPVAPGASQCNPRPAPNSRPHNSHSANPSAPTSAQQAIAAKVAARRHYGAGHGGRPSGQNPPAPHQRQQQGSNGKRTREESLGPHRLHKSQSEPAIGGHHREAGRASIAQPFKRRRSDEGAPPGQAPDPKRPSEGSTAAPAVSGEGSGSQSRKQPPGGPPGGPRLTAT